MKITMTIVGILVMVFLGFLLGFYFAVHLGSNKKYENEDLIQGLYVLTSHLENVGFKYGRVIEGSLYVTDNEKVSLSKQSILKENSREFKKYPLPADLVNLPSSFRLSLIRKFGQVLFFSLGDSVGVDDEQGLIYSPVKLEGLFIARRIGVVYPRKTPGYWYYFSTMQ